MKHRIGIRETEFGYRAFIRVRGRLCSKRFPPDATIAEMEDWRAATRTDLLRAEQRTAAATPPPGSFADDVTIYLQSVRAMPTYAWRETDMQHWLAVLDGSAPRTAITSAQIRTALQQWRLAGKTITDDVTDGRGHVIATTTRQAPLSESACNHRRTALMHFFSVMNGKSGANPVRDVPKFREPDPEPRGLSYAQLRKVFAEMPESKTKARVLVMAFTGLPHATLMRLTPSSVNAKAKTLTVPRRRKGKGTKTRTLPLTPEAIQAFKLLTRFDGWGPFSRDSLRRSLQRACIAAKVPVIRGYDLRHSFGTEVYRSSGDIRAVQALLDHSDVKLTERYTLGAVDTRMRAALASVRKRW